MRKFLVSDYDGTFHTDDESIKNNIEKVKTFRNNGNIFAIATGRSFYDFTKLLDKSLVNTTNRANLSNTENLQRGYFICKKNWN